MTEILTAAQMRAVESAAIASGAVTGLELMERAGRGVVQAIIEEWPELRATALRAVVLCGPGGNGGDGFVVARLLKEWGWEVEVFLYGDPSRMPPDARVNYERWMGMGAVGNLDHVEVVPNYGCDIVVDALFGVGLRRKLEGSALIQAECCMHDFGFFRHARVVAVDIPSGLCADSGKRLDPHGFGFHADLTVTFHRKKIGHLISPGSVCGRLRLVDIGLPIQESICDDSAFACGQSFENLPSWHFKEDLSKDTHLHKYSHGHALVLSGGVGHGGSARLAARGALRIGAGVVTLGVPPAALIENASQVTAIMLARVKDAAGLAEVLSDTRINALCIGPGLGVDRAAGLLGVALARGAPLVLDADALTALSRDAGLFGALHGGCVLTPHRGEFARLFPDLATRLAQTATSGPAYSKVDATREAAARAGCVVLFKGADTVIADPSGRCAINSAQYDRAVPWLATAGSGDVLAGFIAGLLARGFDPFHAACTGAWLHVECARSFGPGLIAEDLPEELPKVFRGLGM